MNNSDKDWPPTATLERLRARATLLQRTRRFFDARGVLEVDTPSLVNHPVTDIHLHSVAVPGEGAGVPARYLHTSPEYAMKRLLAAGSGDIYQVGHVFRGHEQGPQHNSEFTLIEWYRVGWTLQALMDEVAALLRELLRLAATEPPQFISYQELLQRNLGIDPLDIELAPLRAHGVALGFSAALCADCDRDALLDLLMGARIGPSLGHERPVFVHHYPVSQAALARAADDSRTALRFELYYQGMELANGFEELGDAAEQRARFQADNRERQRRGLPSLPIDERLLAALEHGLPACSGVAVGFDRVAMIATGATRIEEVLPFPADRA